MTAALESSPRRSAGRVPPHNLEAEESLIGAMMLSRDATAAAVEVGVGADDFYKPAHTLIFEAIVGLYDAYEPIDPTTVGDELRRRGHLGDLGGRQALLRLQAQTPASANASHYAGIVDELALFRRLIAVAGAISELGYDESREAHEAVDLAESLVFDIAQRRAGSNVVRIADVLARAVERLSGPTVEVTGVPSGFVALDDILLGFDPGALYVVAARPSMGKTAFALGIAADVAVTQRRPALVFSMEMEDLELGLRLLAERAKVDLRTIQRSALKQRHWGRVNAAIEVLSPTPLLFDDRPHCSVMDVRATARREKSRHGDLGIVVVDYLQLMEPSSRRDHNREREVAEMARGCKVLARELECPVVVLSQLNRQVEYRGDKRPMLADLRESGEIEQSADAVMFLYRDEVYNEQSDAKGTAEVIVAKHRNGMTGVARLAWLAKYTKFADLSQREEYPAPRQPALPAAPDRERKDLA